MKSLQAGRYFRPDTTFSDYASLKNNHEHDHRKIAYIISALRAALAPLSISPGRSRLKGLIPHRMKSISGCVSMLDC